MFLLHIVRIRGKNHDLKLIWSAWNTPLHGPLNGVALAPAGLRVPGSVQIELKPRLVFVEASMAELFSVTARRISAWSTRAQISPELAGFPTESRNSHMQCRLKVTLFVSVLIY